MFPRLFVTVPNAPTTIGTIVIIIITIIIIIIIINYHYHYHYHYHYPIYTVIFASKSKWHDFSGLENNL